MSLAEYYIAKLKKLFPYRGAQYESWNRIMPDVLEQRFVELLASGNSEFDILASLAQGSLTPNIPKEEKLQLLPLFKVCTTEKLCLSLDRLLCYDKTLKDTLLSFSPIQLKTTLEAFWIYSSLYPSPGRHQRFAVLKELYSFSGTDYLPAIQYKLPGYTKIPSYLSVFTDKSLSLSYKLEKFDECHRRYPKLSTYLENYII